MEVDPFSTLDPLKSFFVYNISVVYIKFEHARILKANVMRMESNEPDFASNLCIATTSTVKLAGLDPGIVQDLTLFSGSGS